MQVAGRLIRVMVAVGDMPKAKAFYSDKLGLKVVQDYRQDDGHWWAALAFPAGGVTLALSTFYGSAKPGALVLYFATHDIAAVHKELSEKGVKVNDVKDDLYGPGSGVKWFSLNDPDGNLIHLVQE
jgi:catechol 2,3-dioxygenase-like lactoylglutathione lyase family enzyme